MNDANNVQLVVDGKIYLREIGAPNPPTGPEWVPGVESNLIGYYSEDGFALTPVPGDESEYTGHNGDVVETDQLPGNWTVGFSGLETKEATVEAYMDVEVGSDGSVTVDKASNDKRYEIVTVGISRNDEKVVTYYPQTKVNEREAITFNRTTLKAYGMTFRTFKDSALGYHFKSWDTKLVPAEVEAQILAITPEGAAEDELVQITGIGFTDATDVDFGVTPAVDFVVVSDTLIVATVPAGSAGSVNVTVVTPVGTSEAFAYTRGA